MDECTDDDALKYFLKVRGYSDKQIAEVRDRQKRVRKNPAGKNAKKQMVVPEGPTKEN